MSTTVEQLVGTPVMVTVIVCTLRASGLEQSCAGRVPQARSPRAVDLLEQAGQHLVGVEIRLGEGARGLRMPCVVAGDLLGSTHGLIESPERQQPVADGVVAAEPGVLDQRGFP